MAVEHPAQNVVGLPWAEAEPRLAGHSLTYTHWITRPPSRPVGEGELRVVAVRSAGSSLTVILAHRSYLPQGPGGAAPR